MLERPFPFKVKPSHLPTENTQEMDQHLFPCEKLKRLTAAADLKGFSPLRKLAVLNGGGLISVYARSLGTADFISM